MKIKHNYGILNAGPVTTFSNHSIVSENRCFLIPKKFPIKKSVIFGCAIPTGAGIIINEIKPKKNIAYVLLVLVELDCLF